MDKYMVLKDHLIHLLTLNMDKYITTKKIQRPALINQSHTHTDTCCGLGRLYHMEQKRKQNKTCMPLQPNPSELVRNWWFVSLCRNTSGQNVSERQRELQLSV